MHNESLCLQHGFKPSKSLGALFVDSLDIVTVTGSTG